MARSAAIGPAMDYFAAEVESPVRTLRSLSYLAVLIGLLGTVTLLALTLWGVETISQLKPGDLRNIYPINAAAITVAVVVFLSYCRYQYKGDQLLLEASRVLGRLSTDVPAGVDPILVASLEKVGEKFKEWGDEVQERHLGTIKDLLQEVQELSEAMRQMVAKTIASRNEEDQSITPLLRAQDAKMELLSQRLDHGFKLLAQPFEQGIPVLERWKESTDNLNRAIEHIKVADLPNRTAELGQATRELAQTVEGLPQTFRDKLQGVERLMAEAAREAFREGLDQAIQGKIEEISATISGLARVVGGMQENLLGLPENISKGLDRSVQEIKGVLVGVETTSHSLKTAIAALPAAFGQHLEGFAGQVSEAVSEAIRQVLLGPPPPHFDGAREITQGLAQINQLLSRAVESLPSFINTLRGEVAKEGQIIVENLDQITGTLSAKVQDLAATMDNKFSTQEHLLGDMKTTLQHTEQKLTEQIKEGSKPPEEKTQERQGFINRFLGR
ncbi:MAG: hypothetical protein KKD99_01600 [Proteobacteria bacterium]|nr:hypothetical protein [Pseudomonadota bacterium]